MKTTWKALCLAIGLIALLAVSIFALSGCGNYDMFDTVYTFDYAIVKMPDGTVKTIELDSWSDYEGEQIQLTDTDGNVYLVSSFNCVLVQENA